MVKPRNKSLLGGFTSPLIGYIYQLNRLTILPYLALDPAGQYFGEGCPQAMRHVIPIGPNKRHGDCARHDEKDLSAHCSGIKFDMTGREECATCSQSYMTLENLRVSGRSRRNTSWQCGDALTPIPCCEKA
jgi:hypothetical protein